MTDDASGGDGNDCCGNGDDASSVADPDALSEIDGTVFSLDSLFDLLSKRRCRTLLAALEGTSSNVVDLSELVDRVAEREVEAGVGDGSETHRQRVAVALHHRFLPKLSTTAVLDYDARSKTVRYRGNEQVAAYLDLFSDGDGE